MSGLVSVIAGLASLQAFHYQYFDGVLASDIELCLSPAKSATVRWRFVRSSKSVSNADVLASPKAAKTSGITEKDCPDPSGESPYYSFRSEDNHEFLISHDGSLVINAPGTDPELPAIHQILLNQVLPTAVSLQGRRVFHAAAIELEEATAIFLGPSGRGKSTLATALARSGARLIGDDCLILEQVVDHWKVIPSYPSLRLWPDSARAVMLDAAESSKESHHGKLIFEPADTMSVTSHDRDFRLRKIYLLNTPAGSINMDQPLIEPLDLSTGFRALLDAQYRLNTNDHEHLADEFSDLARLAAEAPMAMLSYPRDYSKLDLVCKAVFQDLR